MVIFQFTTLRGGSHMKEAEVIDFLRNENEEYKKIEEEHRKLNQFLDEMSKKKYLSSEEEMEKKKLQKQKLQYKDRLAQIIREYKK
jgi:uncharacterized protein YdcH (DUF465 family)